MYSLDHLAKLKRQREADDTQARVLYRQQTKQKTFLPAGIKQEQLQREQQQLQREQQQLQREQQQLQRQHQQLQRQQQELQFAQHELQRQQQELQCAHQELQRQHAGIEARITFSYKATKPRDDAALRFVSR